MKLSRIYTGSPALLPLSGVAQTNVLGQVVDLVRLTTKCHDCPRCSSRPACWCVLAYFYSRPAPCFSSNMARELRSSRVFGSPEGRETLEKVFLRDFGVFHLRLHAFKPTSSTHSFYPSAALFTPGFLGDNPSFA